MIYHQLCTYSKYKNRSMRSRVEQLLSRNVDSGDVYRRETNVGLPMNLHDPKYQVPKSALLPVLNSRGKDGEGYILAAVVGTLLILVILTVIMVERLVIIIIIARVVALRHRHQIMCMKKDFRYHLRVDTTHAVEVMVISNNS